ncbi:M23 family metallopeptidase [Granulicella sp. S190]|uniref:M23 family metallopeptidase n=1 Tax=Granulicella sp. S190 TaxID=1747226 RepID=UPI00131E33CE|nr:M23 family metallopeptidase [Granulicella sp. S190]
MTPLLLTVHDAPVPFKGSDGLVHLVYEVWLANISSGEADIQDIDVIGDGAVVQRLDATAVSHRLQPAGLRESSAVLTRGTQSILFLNVILPNGTPIPKQLLHRVKAHYSAAPPGRQEIVESGGATTPDLQPVVRISAPLRGDRYVSADSCCDSTRHMRAAMPINGRVYVAQRYAVDWEQLDVDNRIYAGPREKLESYTIFGKPVYAVADGVVAVAVTGLPEQTPGKYPTNISIEEADGNAIIEDLGGHHFACYAHMQSSSIHLHRGDKVKAGQVIGLVGNSGNSVAPHLHFHVMSSELSLASNGLPYQIDAFKVTGATPGTEAFDEAEEKGTPLAVKAFSPPHVVEDSLPLDQLIISLTPW